ncbi:hypothetical protein GCM10009757_41470 [Streptomyces cheonanensis]|uniref:Uncharacterized protein n=1 Tax=Streptomyces cheonanensis TaxID=312720 RepID=A0ABN2VDB3_9ACTN
MNALAVMPCGWSPPTETTITPVAKRDITSRSDERISSFPVGGRRRPTSSGVRGAGPDARRARQVAATVSSRTARPAHRWVTPPSYRRTNPPLTAAYRRMTGKGNVSRKVPHAAS